MDPNNAPAKADLAKVLPKIPKVTAPIKTAAPSDIKETAKRRVRIEEIDDDESSPPQVTPSTSKPVAATKVDVPTASKQASESSPIIQASSSKQAPPSTKAHSQPIATSPAKPTTPLEFIRLFTTYRGNDAGLASILKMVAPSDLTKLFSNQLEGDHLSTLARVFNSSSFRDEPQLLEYLTALSKTNRFGMTKMLMTDEDVANFKQLFAHLSVASPANADQIAQLQKKFSS